MQTLYLAKVCVRGIFYGISGDFDACCDERKVFPVLNGERVKNEVRGMNDDKILDLYWQRNELAIEASRQKYGGLCRSVAGRILPDERDAEECVSDVWLRLWNSIPPQRPDSLKAYIARIVRNLALDRFDYNHAEQRSSALTEAYEELEDILFICNQEGEGAEKFREVLNEFLGGLKKEARVYFVRRYWYGESIREIAQACGAGESKVKSSLMRTRNSLRDVLEKEGVSL